MPSLLSRKRGVINIWISIAMSVILLIICSGTALGIAMAAKRNQSGAEPSNASLVAGGGKLTYPAGSDPNEIGTCLDNFLKKAAPRSPLIGHGIALAKAGQTYNVNPGFMLAISSAESTYATAYIERPKYREGREYNFFNMRNRSGFKKGGDGYIDFASFEESIPEYAKLLRTNYLDKGFTSLDEKFRDRYCDPPSKNSSCVPWLSDTTNAFSKITSACPVLAVSSAVATANGKKICIDAGHNSNESRGFVGGAEGANNLEIANKLNDTLKKNGFETFMTRTGTVYNGPEAKRKSDVNNAGCAVSVSIHSNAGGGSGTQTYVCDQNYPQRWDSFPSPIDSPSKSPLQYKIGNNGSALANVIHPLVVQAFIGKDAGIHPDTGAGVMRFRKGSNGPDKQVSNDGNGWASSLGMVCRTKIPSILIEVGFHDRADEATKLKDPSKQQQVADAITTGLKKFLGKK